jgi:hypothetical protein
MSSGLVVARYDYPVIELAPLAADPDQTVEQMIAGLPHNNPDITSAHFPARRAKRSGRGKGRLFLAKPLHDRQHVPREDVLRLLESAGFVPGELPELALLKDHAEELWGAGVRFVGALGANSVWPGPDGGYAPYLILNPEDRGFHLHWLESEWGGPVWFVVRRAAGREVTSVGRKS